MAFRPIPILHAFIDNLGQPLAGGTVEFCEAGTTIPVSVYGEEALTTNLGSTLTLDAAGRLAVYPWASEAVYVVIKDANGAVVDEADHVAEEGASGTTFPTQAGNGGRFLTTDGSAMAWDDVLQVPDPTGNANKILSNDGVSPVWIAKPADGAAGANPDIVNTASSTKVGDGTTRMMIRRGTGSAPASGGRTTSVAVSFGQTFLAAPFVAVTPTINVITGVGYSPIVSVTGVSTTGCTVNVDVNSDQSGANIGSAVTFEWLAFGAVA